MAPVPWGLDPKSAGYGEDAIAGGLGYIDKGGRLVPSHQETSRGEPKLAAGSSGGRKHRSPGRLEGPTLLRREQSSKQGAPEVYSLVTTTDFALLATLMHDAISHLMNAIDKAAKVREPIDRIADAMEDTAAAVRIALQCQTTHVAASGRKSRRSATLRAQPSKPPENPHNRRHSSPRAKA
jgi:hypothetical protein